MTRRAAPAVDGQLGLFGGGGFKMSGGGVQPDLFGEFDAEAERRAVLAARRQADKDRYERWRFVAPYDTADVKAGDEVLGWVCPACRGVEWSEFVLSLNHGYDPGRFEAWPGQWAGEEWGVACHRTMKRGYREEHSMPGLPHLEDGLLGVGVTARVGS